MRIKHLFCGWTCRQWYLWWRLRPRFRDSERVLQWKQNIWDSELR